MTLHYTKYHAKHVAIINGMIEGTEMEKDSLQVCLVYTPSIFPSAVTFCPRARLACSCAHTKIHVS
jgi:hypothetical protein